MAGYGSHHARQEPLRANSMETPDELGDGLAQVSVVWHHALQKDPGLGLWVHDGIHANVAGSFLAASVFYAVFPAESPEGLTYTKGEALDPATARSLRIIAAETVLANPAEWNLARQPRARDRSPTPSWPCFQVKAASPASVQVRGSFAHSTTRSLRVLSRLGAGGLHPSTPSRAS